MLSPNANALHFSSSAGSGFHHKIGGLATGKPIFFLNEPVGATGCIIANLYEQNNITISKEMAGLMMSAILSDPNLPEN
jgi:inorganic pyrophosphatase/exopolyphosphatase